MPKISAVMALYNTPYDYLQATVESILNQTFADFELIVIDDASSIEYKEFFEKFNDKRIKYSKLDKNGGPGHARNEGIKKSLGEYIGIVDSDDIYLPQRFEIQADFLDRNDDISLISCAFKQSNNQKISAGPEKDEDIKIAMLFNSQLANPAVMFRRNVFAENSLFYTEDTKFGEDYELWLEAMFAGIKMANLKDVLMIYTRRRNQLSKAKSDLQRENLKKIYKKTFSKIGLNPTQEDVELNYNIYSQKYDNVSAEQVQNWFHKIIEKNREIHLFKEELLIKYMNQSVSQLEKFKDRFFKIKLGQYNFCINKNFKLYFEKRD